MSSDPERIESVPVPPKNAQKFKTVCQFCIVGCGYDVFKWPEGMDGSPTPDGNALDIDFRKPQPVNGIWISQNMHSVVTDQNGSRHNIVIIPDHHCTVNSGLASVRGGGLAKTLYSEDSKTSARLKHPLLIGENGHAIVSWAEAVDLGSRIIKAVIDRWGPDAVAMKFFDHGGGGGGFENNWAIGKFFFSSIGTRRASIHNRPAYNSEVHAAGDAGLAPLTNSYVDAQLADTIMIVGANPYETQTNYFLNHMVKNLNNESRELREKTFVAESLNDSRMIIVDPRRTMTVAAAEAAAGAENVLHLQIEPGTDIVLLNTIGRIILDRRWYDVSFIRERTEWQTFEAYQRSSLGVDIPLKEFVAKSSKICKIAKADFYKAAKWIAKPKVDHARQRVLFHYEKGLIWGLKNYENVASIVDLALMTGNVGKPGTGCSRLGGHQEAYVRPPYPGGRPALNVDESIKRGEVKVFWIGGCNPVLTTLNAEAFETSLIERGAPVRTAIEETEGRPIGERIINIVDALKDGGTFVLAQDLYMTASTQHAHIVLPAAGWGEMNLTSINGERRLRLYEKFMSPPGEALPDWKIISAFAKRLRDLYTRDRNPLMANRYRDYRWKTDEDVFIHARYNFKGNSKDPMEGYAGITYDLLKKLGNNGIQTPTRIINGIPVGSPRLYENGEFGTPSGKARFIPAPRPWPGYAATIMYQREKRRFWINNGRVNHVWQTLYHHQHIEFYHERYPMPCLEMNLIDAAELGVTSGDLLEVYNDFGSVRTMAYVTDSVKKGHTFMLFGQPRGAAGDLVSDHVDPSTTIPYYKGVWADIRRIGAAPKELKQVTFLPRNFTG